MTATLLDAAERNRIFPDTFEVPTQEEIEAIKPGMAVQIAVSFMPQYLDLDKHPHGNLLKKHPLTRRKSAGERFWVRVNGRHGEYFSGTVLNWLYFPYVHGFECNDDVLFEGRNILKISDEE